MRVSGALLMTAHRYRVPTANGAVLAEPGFEAIPALVEANRKLLDRTDVMIGGLPLRELRALARREVLELAHADHSPDGPLLLAGHEPELSHPGAWVKNFALTGLARKLDGIPLNLVVDHDTLKDTSFRFPVFTHRDPASVRTESLAFDNFAGEVPYEDRTVIDEEQFRTFADRAAPLCANWGYEPLLSRCWASLASGGRKPPEKTSQSQRFGSHSGGLRPPLATHAINIGERFVATRRYFEREWGCHNLEITVSRLSQTEVFAHFVRHIVTDLPRFRKVYNAAIRAYRKTYGIRSANHPAPELAEGEAPFWVHKDNGKREHATPSSGVRTLRPRALTLTLFARVCLGDFFIHGVGGGKYDEVTDAIIRDYFGIEPPAYQVLSATLHLPLPAFRSTVDDLKRAERHLRDLHWNPQRHLSAEQLAAPEVQALLSARAALVTSEPPYAEHAARRRWFRDLQQLTERLRPFVRTQVPDAEARLRRVQDEVDANAVLQRRDYAWVLYPEGTLRLFLQQFLRV